jgi:hypothetical protein
MMDVSNSVYSAASGSDAQRAAVGMKLLSNVKDIQTAQAASLLQDFASSQPAPHPYLGKTLDIRF